MKEIRVQFTWLTAFYSPLVVTLTGSFLRDQGIRMTWSLATPGRSAVDALVDGSADLVQTTLSNAFGFLGKGQQSPCLHFGLVNETDGFFLTARHSDAAFHWKKLEGAKLLILHGGQPMQMFKYACHRQGVDVSRIHLINVPPAEMDQAFRDGAADYIHQQGPAPQQLVADGCGSVVARVGPAVGRCGFSSLAASRQWLATDEAQAFTRAYQAAKSHLVKASAQELADALAPFFPDINKPVLQQCLHDYQQLGCWSEEIAITPDLYERMLDIYAFNGAIDQRYPYGAVCARPPGR